MQLINYDTANSIHYSVSLDSTQRYQNHISVQFFLRNLSLFYLFWLANYCINLMIVMKLNSLISLQSCGALQEKWQEFKNHGNFALTF